MNREFIEKLNNHEYISKSLFNSITNKEIIPYDFNLDKQKNLF